MDGRICIIANGGAGRRKASRSRAAVAALAEGMDRPPELRLVAEGSQLSAAAAAAVAEGFQVVIAAGGDGTVAAVADAVAGHDVVLGVLPLGTFNFFARGLGLPEDPVAAARVLATGRVRAIDLAEVNGKVFLNNASLGLYPAILAERELTYRRWGRSRLAAYWSVLRTIFSYRDRQWLRLHVDGGQAVIRSPSVFVAASAYQLEHYGLKGADLLRQGKLAVFVAPDVSHWRMAGIALRLAMGRASPYRDFILLGGAQVRIDARKRRRTVASDGEFGRMQAPFLFTLRPGALRVIVPGDPPGEAGDAGP